MEKTVGVVGLGVYRHVAASTDTTFENTPYRMAAIVDLSNPPEAFRYTPHNLGVVLHCLQPRPLVFVTGAAISHEMTNESIRVWEEFVKATGTEKTLVINLQGDPPADGNWRAEIMRRLDEKYRNNNTSN
ncbi:uncharacterized protein LY89DRAFT_782491 [Mollisia scopiformis]|uniref:Uncharacterized protein n=1 Tax=Mollisia scopiformis TaxID=149040 RepID=A0A194X7P9_MOLSC|nr:uncharacterized protein LY89DRAFT_782491 [Mollisia scopiformis]KUJ16193.1 hypothetical protein LY89DRAFT_782491 [Mollisia scopiformis]